MHEKMIVAGELQLEKLKEKSFDFGLTFQLPDGPAKLRHEWAPY